MGISQDGTFPPAVISVYFPNTSAPCPTFYEIAALRAAKTSIHYGDQHTDAGEA